jgi:hypothetical protein
MMDNYVINPKTGRRIKVGGPTFIKLNEDNVKIKSPAFKSPSPSKRHKDTPISDRLFNQMMNMPVMKESIGKGIKGWNPPKHSERPTLRDKCGEKCFLLPDSLSFPICPKCTGDMCKCNIDCRGLVAAKIRSKQHKYVNVRKTADKLSERCKQMK